MGQRPAEFTPADRRRRDVHEQMWRNALKFQKPRSFFHSGKARGSSSDRSRDGRTAAVRPAAVTSCVYRVARRYEWNAATEVAQATSFAALDARRNAHAAARVAGGAGRGVRARGVRPAQPAALQRRLHLAAIHAAHYTRRPLNNSPLQPRNAALSLYPTLQPIITHQPLCLFSCTEPAFDSIDGSEP